MHVRETQFLRHLPNAGRTLATDPRTLSCDRNRCIVPAVVPRIRATWRHKNAPTDCSSTVQPLNVDAKNSRSASRRTFLAIEGNTTLIVSISLPHNSSSASHNGKLQGLRRPSQEAVRLRTVARVVAREPGLSFRSRGRRLHRA